MEKSFLKMLQGYELFRDKYVHGDSLVMQYLSHYGQQPKTMVVACCDSRVDPALIMQCDPGDLFVVRNVANIVPPFEKDEWHHGTSAALEFGVRVLEVENLILLGHSQCGGIHALLSNEDPGKNDFISNWVSLIHPHHFKPDQTDECAKQALNQSYENCLTFPWIRAKVEAGQLIIHLWFFDIKTGQIYTYSNADKQFEPLTTGDWHSSTAEPDS
jgi:carbonic anhydrase